MENKNCKKSRMLFSIEVQVRVKTTQCIHKRLMQRVFTDTIGKMFSSDETSLGRSDSVDFELDCETVYLK